MKRLFKIIQDSSNLALNDQRKDGSMIAGHNGPYFHSETPIRNTCHWIIAFLKAYKITGDDRYLKASGKCIDFLIESKGEYNYHHRAVRRGYDMCNGLIGPAWTMEALLVAAKELNRKDLEGLASQIFLLHKFDYNLGLWHKTAHHLSTNTYPDPFR